MATRIKTVHFALGNSTSNKLDAGKVWTQTGATWTNRTATYISAATADVPLGGAVGDELYIGSLNPFVSVCHDTSTAPTGTVTWEYWNGSAWTACPSLSGSLPTDNTVIRWNRPTDWATTQVNGEGDGPWYYVRMRRTGAGTGGTISGGNLGICHQFASARSMNLPDLTGTPTIRSASIRLTFQGDSVAIVENLRIMGRFNAASYADLTAHWTTTNNFSHAEVWSHQAYIGVTGIAQTAFTAGATVTFDGWIAAVYRGVASAGFGMSVSAELLITYEYDDTATNLLITHILPIDSLTGVLGTTLTTIGGAGGVPDLAADIIKESSYTIKDLYFRFVFNLNMAGTADFSFAAALDSESEVTLATFDAAASGDPYMELVWRRTDMSVTDAHDLKARVTSAAGATPEHVGALLIVTYEFPSSSTTRTHTMVMPRELNQTFGTGTAATDRFIRFVEFDIEDTSPALLRGGGLMVTHQSADPGSLLFRFGTQSYASYTVSPGDVSGPVPFIQRFDAGAVVGTGGLTLARGKNTLNMEGYYTTSPQLGGAISALIFLTYSYTQTAGKQPSTACFNAHLAVAADTWAVATRQSKTGSFQWFIPETSRRVQVAGLDMIDNNGSADTMARLRIALGADKGYFLSPGTLTGIDANVGVRKFVCEVSGFKEYPTQPDTQWTCDPTAAALNTVMDGTATTRMMSALCWANWHDYTWTVSGTVSGYDDADGAGLTVEIWDATEKRLIATVTTTAGGAFTATVYDNTRNKQAICQEDATHVGASAAGTP